MDPVAEIPGLQSLHDSVSGGAPEILIAIIDGPADLDHPSFKNARVMSEKVGGDSGSAIRSEHGTHVSSVLVGQQGSPVLGIAPNCTAIVYSIYNESGDGELEPTSQATLALAINRAVADGADIINISSGQQTPTGQAQSILADAVRRASEAGALIVAAAGNDGCRCLQVPAALNAALAVGACDLNGRPLDFSNFGDAYLENGILAPGEHVKGASPQANVALRSGTSFATPIVSGVAALLLSRLRQQKRGAEPHVVREALLASAIPCAAGSGERCLAGLLNVPATVAALFPDEANVARTVPASEARAPPALRPSARQSVHANSARVSTPSTVTRESTMADSSTIAAAAPRILGPDGNAIASTAAVAPSEAPSTPAPHPAPTAHVTPAATVQATPAMSLAPSAGPAIATPPVMQSVSAMQPSAADCGCGGVRPSQATTSQMAFPIGRLYYDFGTEARLDYFVQAIANWRDGLGHRGGEISKDFGPHRDTSGDTAAPYNPEYMVRYLMNLVPGEQQRPPDQDSNLRDADAVHWTLTIDAVPIYRIRPLDVFGLGFFLSLISALFAQEVSEFPPSDPRSFKDPAAPVAAASATTMTDEDVETGVTRVSVAGWLDGGTTRLLNGTVVPTLNTDWRGFYQWNIDQLLGPKPWPEGVSQFLSRIYNEFRNVGVAPQNRALNYSAMNAHNTKKIFNAMAKQGKRLDTVEVDRSAICRPESDCWDVTYRFFNPNEVLTQARQVFQYTIDVSDLVPVAVGPLRNWQIY
jgi:cyanobactin maturation PatA/PatG family protease